MVQNRRFEEHSKLPTFGARHVQSVLIFWGIAVIFALRVNLSVGIVAMTDDSDPNQETFVWTERTKSLVLSSFFWGYFVMQIPAGQLAHRFGGKLLFMFAILISSLTTILTPWCVRMGGWKMLCALRFVVGMTQSPVTPSAHTLLSKWAPVEERGTLATLSYSGAPFGMVVMLAISGYLASTPIGWPLIFYVSGLSGILWTLAWLIWGASSPREYRGISMAERDLIESSLARSMNQTHDAEKTTAVPLSTPWRAIFTSPPFWVLTISHCLQNWGFWTLLTQIPSYMKHVLGFDIKSNALLSSLPYLAMLVLSFVFCGISKLLDHRYNLSINTSRKLFNTISQWVPMVTIIALGYIDRTQTTLAVVLLVVTVGMNSALGMGHAINHIDLSPNFAGILMSFTNFMANTMSVGAPLFVGIIVTDVKNLEQWRIVFFLTGAFYFVGNLMFLLFGKTNVQSWNNPPSSLEQMTPLSVVTNKEKEEEEMLEGKS